VACKHTLLCARTMRWQSSVLASAAAALRRSCAAAAGQQRRGRATLGFLPVLPLRSRLHALDGGCGRLYPVLRGCSP
jgi:hypothetical protein